MTDDALKTNQTLFKVNGEKQGLLILDNQIAGCYLHGLFDMPEALQLIMHWVDSDVGESISIDELENIAINRISDACLQYL